MTAEKPAAWEAEEALLQQQHGKPLSSKKKQGAGKISKYEGKEEVESEIPQDADYDEAHVEGRHPSIYSSKHAHLCDPWASI